MGGAIGISFFVGLETESVALGKGGHLGDRHHVSARTLQHHHVGVVDHADLASSRKVLESVREKHFAIEAGKGGKELEKQHAGVTQHQRSGLHQA